MSVNDLYSAQDNLDLREFGRTLIRHKRMILAITGLTLLLILLATLLSKPAYRATATLQIEREPTRVVDIDFLGNSDIRDTRDFYQTQFELIRSRALAAQVIKDLKLQDTLGDPSILKQLKQWLGFGDTSNIQSELEDGLLENLEVEPVKNSRLVAISYISATPEDAAKIANGVVAAFREMNAQRRHANIPEATSLLEKSAQETKAKLDEAQQHLSDYIRDKQIFQADAEETNNTALLKKLNNDLTQLQNQRLNKEDQYAQQTNKASRPAVTLKTEIDELKKQENTIHETIAKTKEQILKEQDAAMDYNALKREVAVNQTLYQNVLQRLKEASIASGAISNNVSVVDPAQVPLKKFKPNLLANLLFGTLLGLLLGTAAAFLREFLDDTARDVSKLEHATQLPVVGVLPEDKTIPAALIGQATTKKSLSALAEAFRTLRTTLRFHQKPSAHYNVLLITSTGANEGKTTVAANLAGTYSRTGRRVLLIDADLRNPSLHKVLEIEVSMGLTDYLHGHIDSHGLILPTSAQNLYLLPAGQAVDDPAELLTSPRMLDLLNTLQQEFDQIIIDSSPMAGLADALVLATLSSATLLVVRAESTRMESIQKALHRLHQAKASLLGIVLNRADMAKAKSYGYEYAEYPYQPPTTSGKRITSDSRPA